MPKRPILYVAAAVIVIAGLALAWWLGSPLFINRTVDEGADFLAPTEEAMTEEVMTEEAMTEEAPTEAAMSAEEIAAKATADAEAASMPDVVMTEEMPADAVPTAIKAGMFMGADSFHTGSGDAMIYELPDGSHVLRFENFEVINGPDLHIVLSGTANPTSSADVMVSAVDLGQIKGNIGDQNYDIPAGTDISTIQSVVVYCQPFHVIFATAPLN
jgi:Electron transfer DM13